MKTFFAIAVIIGLTAFVGFQTYSAIKEIRAKKRSKEVKKDANSNGNN